MDKLIRLAKALRAESLKRLPWILGTIIAVFLVGGAISFFKTAQAVQIGKDNTVKLRSLSEDNKRLIQQNKNLTQQNIELSKQNADHLDCITKLFISFINNGPAPGQVDVKRCRAIVDGSQITQQHSGSSMANAAPSKPKTQTSSKKTTGSTGSSGGQPSSYTQCVGDGSGVLGTLGKVVSCL